MSGLTIPPLDIRTDTITAAGISSGGFMSTMMFLTDPELFKGIGPVISGPPLHESKFEYREDQPPADINFDDYMNKLYAREKAG